MRYVILAMLENATQGELLRYKNNYKATNIKNKELDSRESHTGLFPKHKMNRIMPSGCPIQTPPYDPRTFQYWASVAATGFLGGYAVQGRTRPRTHASLAGRFSNTRL
jgi:hypothetical protein